ncbi:MAG TPA: hypothetical protein PKC19_16240 [Roseiflexaceae bacterium]|nr:hypothetical protein [Roseiflexaceae bacterium]
MTPITLAAIHHDPGGRLTEQIARLLPQLQQHFAALVVCVTDVTPRATFELLASAGACVRREPAAGALKVGRARRTALALALEYAAHPIFACDFDRALHWLEYYPAELQATVTTGAEYDFCVFGRTPRAFASHPQVQRDTEAIINTVFARMSGCEWDLVAAARSLSRPAATAILRDCPEEGVGVDMAWPLFLQRSGGFRRPYHAGEGLEFETADRYPAEIAAAGGLAAWIAAIDADPLEWVQRLAIARAAIEAGYPYLQ